RLSGVKTPDRPTTITKRATFDVGDSSTHAATLHRRTSTMLLTFLFKPGPGGSGAGGANQVVVCIENLDCRPRCKLIPAGSEFQGSRNPLRSDIHAGRAIAVIRKSQRVL